MTPDPRPQMTDAEAIRTFDIGVTRLLFIAGIGCGLVGAYSGSRLLLLIGLACTAAAWVSFELFVEGH